MPGGSSRRQQRVSELLHEELSILVSSALTDPRLADAMINVTDVVVSSDLRNARVYIEHVLPASASRQVLELLNRAQSFLRQALVENLNLRYVPELTFQVDRSGARSQRVDEILDNLATSAPGVSHERDTDIDAAD